jgi:hypothetical protein
LLTDFRNNKPFWFKFLALVILVIILSLKIGGLSNFWLVYSSIGMTLGISYQLFNLYLLYLTDQKKTNIPFILPNLIQNWLKTEFEELSHFNQAEMNFLKNEYYLNLFICLAILMIVLVIRI